jgi:hypothetical protein
MAVAERGNEGAEGRMTVRKNDHHPERRAGAGVGDERGSGGNGVNIAGIQRLAELRVPPSLVNTAAYIAGGVSAAELAARLGLKNLKEMGSGRALRTRRRVGAVEAIETFFWDMPVRRRELFLRALARRLSTQFGGRLSSATLRRWQRVARQHGIAALVDRRGRPRGHRPVDSDLLVSFLKALAAGSTAAAAHRATYERALAEGRSWPRSAGTVRKVLRTQAIDVTARSADQRTGPNEYLTTGSMN